MTKDQILSSEYSFRFDEIRQQLMTLPEKPEVEEQFNKIRQNMMVVSYYKYGPMQENYNEYKCMDAIGNIRKRLIKYHDTGNTEFLADVANFAMIEFMYPSVKGAKYLQTRSKTYSANKSRNPFGIIETAIYEYEETKNTAYLVEIANLALQEFAYPSLEGAHYTPTDNDACEIAGFSVNEIKRYV